MDKLLAFTKQYTKSNAPQLRSGDTIRVHERIKEGGSSNSSGQAKERVQIFEGLVIATKHGVKGPNATFTVRKISAHGVGVEKVFPLHSPVIQKIEIIKHDKVRRAKLYYVRDLIGKKKKRKAAKMLGTVYEELSEAPENGEDSEQENTSDKKEVNVSEAPKAESKPQTKEDDKEEPVEEVAKKGAKSEEPEQKEASEEKKK